MKIVVASPRVLEDWLTLRKRLFDDLDDEFHRREMAAWLAGPDRECWMAYEEGKAAGFLEASLRNIVDGCLSSPVGYIEGIFVTPEYRGHGLARALIQTAEKWMAARGCVEVATDTELDNETAMDFHKAMGFRETYRIVEFVKPLPP